MIRKNKKTPDDYADVAGLVYFEIPNASKNLAFGILEDIDQVLKDTRKEVDNGFEVVIHNQQIAEIV